jgi:ferredoxin
VRVRKRASRRTRRYRADRITVSVRQNEGDQMRVVVDFDKCTSNALCMNVAPEIFEVRDDGFLYILNEEPAEAQRATVQAAVDICPNHAISIAD